MIHFFELLYLLVMKELKVRYKSSVFGYLWALANPFAFALVYYVAFKLIMRVEMPNYSIFLLTGMFPWLWLTNSLVHATGSLRNSASLVKKVDLVRAVLPLGSVIHEMVHFCFALPVVCAFIYFSDISIFLSWLWQFPLIIILQLLMIYPFALILSIANVFIHDVEYLIAIVLSMLFFLTPIVYPISMVPESYRSYFEYSPIAALIDVWRGVFLHGTINTGQLAFCVFVGAITSVVSYFFYKRTVSKIGELL